MADYIRTFTGIDFSPLHPNKDDINIDDIAHALSLMTRANGHFPIFYSVAQHCIACCKEAMARNYDKRIVLACLLHDAGEAYMSDVTRPLKKHLDFYVASEEKLLDTIYSVFLTTPLTENECEIVKEVDDTMLYHEFLHFMNLELPQYKGRLITQPIFECIEFQKVENEFKEIFNKIIKQ